MHLNNLNVSSVQVSDAKAEKRQYDWYLYLTIICFLPVKLTGVHLRHKLEQQGSQFVR